MRIIVIVHYTYSLYNLIRSKVFKLVKSSCQTGLNTSSLSKSRKPRWCARNGKEDHFEHFQSRNY